ncbi:hypothetical protein [Halobacillus sp. A5]|uniref:hypothetical protein n=1 Tax=Halobacillus sp. A5 TaxID=2880263 RepID=UPI0020A67B0A|nr:hypothetical protein [Halobacillus sp. A5]MCP3026023.1 hypothetical protein [Halobacillus sp. A5]
MDKKMMGLNEVESFEALVEETVITKEILIEKADDTAAFANGYKAVIVQQDEDEFSKLYLAYIPELQEEVWLCPSDFIVEKWKV